MRPFRSIRVKITVGIVGLLVVMTIVTAAVAFERSESALREQITHTHEARVTAAAQEVDQTLDRVKNIALATVLEAEMADPITSGHLDDNGTVPKDGLGVKRLLLNHAHRADDVFFSALILGPTGHVLMGEPFPLQEERSAATENPQIRERYARIAEFTAQVPAPVVHAGGDGQNWTVSARLSDTTGATWGVLVLEASTEVLGQTIGATAQGDTFFVILDRLGIVLMGPPGIPPGTDLSAQQEELQEHDRSSGVILHDGTEYLATVAPLGDGWRLIVAQEARVAFAPVTQMLTTILLTSTLLIAAGVVIGLLVAGRITAPVVGLKRAAERVARGEYGTQVRATTKDEIADLAASFNLMSTRLLEEHKRLERHRRTLETTVEERTAELEAKNEELEAFVYAASHDMRTPLISLDWLAKELEDAIRTGDTDAAQEMLRRVRANIEGMDRLIGDLLELSRIGRTEGAPEAVMLRPIIEKAWENLAQASKGRGTRIRIRFDDSVIVEADPRRMEQVFHNLLGNAIKHGRKGGRVDVRAKPIGEPRRPWKWRVEVADDGPGIAAGNREAVFYLFRRGVKHEEAEEEAAEGTGVGLAVVRKIIRSYGGEIKAARSEKGGALLWFTLNAARTGPGPSPAAADEEPAREPEQEPGPDREGALRPSHGRRMTSRA